MQVYEMHWQLYIPYKKFLLEEKTRQYFRNYKSHVKVSLLVPLFTYLASCETAK
jgi:hypothetical protein